MEKIKTDRKKLKAFSRTLSFALIIIGTILLIRGRQIYLWFYLLGLLLFLLGMLAVDLLKPVYIFWMKLAFVLSWINTRLILIIIYYLVFTPIGLGLRLFGIDLLDKKIKKGKDSYWYKNTRKKFEHLDYERQF